MGKIQLRTQTSRAPRKNQWETRVSGQRVQRPYAIIDTDCSHVSSAGTVARATGFCARESPTPSTNRSACHSRHALLADRTRYAISTRVHAPLGAPYPVNRNLFHPYNLTHPWWVLDSLRGPLRGFLSPSLGSE